MKVAEDDEKSLMSFASRAPSIKGEDKLLVNSATASVQSSHKSVKAADDEKSLKSVASKVSGIKGDGSVKSSHEIAKAAGDDEKYVMSSASRGDNAKSAVRVKRSPESLKAALENDFASRHSIKSSASRGSAKASGW